MPLDCATSSSAGGDPTLRAVINNSGGTTGDFHVRDGNLSSNIFTVATGGIVTVTNSIERAGVVELANVTSGASAMLDLYAKPIGLGAKTKRMEFVHDSTNTLAKIKASSANYALRLEGAPVDLNNPASSSATICRFLTNGSSHMTFYWDGSTGRVSMIVSGTTTDFELSAPRALYLTVGTGTDSGSGLIVQNGAAEMIFQVREDGHVSFMKAGVGYGYYQPTDGATDSTTTLEVGSDGSRGKVRLRADTADPEQQGILVFESQDTSATNQVHLYCWYESGRIYLYADNEDPAGTAGTANRVGLGDWAAS